MRGSIMAIACIVAACLLLGFTVPSPKAHKCALWSEAPAVVSR